MGFLGALLSKTKEGGTGLNDVMTQVNTVVNAIIMGLGGIVVLFAIYLAYKFMTADDDGKRKNAKAQMIYAIVGIFAVIVILILWNTVLKEALKENTGVS
jgi:Na+/proline symporter